MGPLQHGPGYEEIQEPGRRRPRRRRCLLKGCEKPFHPRHPQARYCSEACRQAARRWRAWRARRRYRGTVRGKACRCQQSRRYRARCQQRRERAGDSTGSVVSEGASVRGPSCRVAAEAGASAPPAGREGQRPAHFFKKSSCDRPGCYTCFDPHPRSPLQRFCSSLCRRALQRVLEREARWRRSVWSRRFQSRPG